VKKHFDVIVVIPVGPGTVLSFVADTIHSFIFYTRSTYKIIIADDSHQGIGEHIKNLFPATDIVITPKPMGGWAGLYINLANTFSYAVNNYHFKVLLKLDTDALVINPSPEKEALEIFTANPDMGLAGQYPNEYDGSPWDIGWPKARILNGATTWKYIRRPIANWYVRKFYLQAKANGYKAGESVFGGAYFFSNACLTKLLEKGLLPHLRLGGANLGEDHLFALLVKAAGFNLGDLSTGNLPFACAWRGLPAAPEKLYKEGKKIIHSTRFWKERNEEELRAFYQMIREKTVVENRPTFMNNG
jgi:hypothetical protein